MYLGVKVFWVLYSYVSEQAYNCCLFGKIKFRICKLF